MPGKSRRGPRTMLNRRWLLGLVSLCFVLGPAPAGAQRVGPGGAPPVGSGPVDVTGFVRVIDGDTIEAYIGGKRAGIGLIGLDAPMGNTACGRDAAAALRGLVRGGLRLEEDPGSAFDALGRRMYYGTTRDGKSIAEEQVKAGVAQAGGEGRERDTLAAAEATARAAGRGCLWRGQRTTGADGPSLMAMNLGGAEPTGAPTVARLAPLGAALPSGFSEAVVAAGLTSPTAFAFLPDGRILIAEKQGTVRVVKNGALLATPFIDIRDRVNDYWDRGLLGIAADPSFVTNGYVYLLYTYENDAATYSGTKTARLARYTASGDTASPASEAVILGTSVGSSCNNFPKGADCIPSDSPSHGVGNIKFAPDSSMFVITGDGAHFNYVDDDALRAQDLDLLSGKLLRVTPAGAGLSSNPFWNGTASANRSKVWGYGLRNPYRFNLRPGTDLPYLGDVGWNTWEEVNVGAKGANLGWPCYEGSARQAGYEPKAACQSLYGQVTAAVTMPLLPYDHAGSSAAVTGGAFYTGTAYPSQYQGAYFYADYSDGWIRSLRVDDSNKLVSGSVADFASDAQGPVAIEAGPDADLYYLAIGANELRRIRYAPTVTISCATGQYLAQYYTNKTLGGTPALTRCEAAPINYDWGSGGPGSGIPNDNFSARWADTHSFAAGDYTFSATADDGIRVWVDGALIIDAWVDQGPTTYTATRTLTAADHEVKVEYYENGGGAVAKLSWQAATNQPPTATISAPAPTTRFKVGDVIAFSGSATDPEDGSIPASGLAWRVVIKHCSGGQCHDHQLTTAGGTGGSFAAPDHEEDFSIEITLTATDSKGLTGTVSVAIQPQTVRLTLDTSPSGLQVVYNGQAGTAPLTRTPIVGGTRTISAPSPQGSYTFASWSDGGAQQHDVTVPATDATYTASFSSGTADTTAPRISNIKIMGHSGSKATISWTTDEPADSQVEYRTAASTAYSSTPRDPSLGTSHSQRLTGLASKTVYYFRVKSRDAAGNLATSADRTFTTK